MRVSAQDGVDAGDAAGHFQIHIHAVVAEQHHHLRTFGARFVAHGLHVLVLNAKGPVGHHVPRVGNGCVGKGLANDGAGHAIDFLDHIGLENGVAKILGLDVLRHKIDLAREIFFNDFFHPVHAQGEFPMTRHDIHAEQLAGVHHVLAVGPQAGARALPGITAVEQQSAGPAGPHALDQGGQVGKAPYFAVTRCGFFKIQIGQCMRLHRVRAQLGNFEQVLADQVRQVAFHGTQAHVDAGFAKINGFELRMAIGHVQERDAAKFFNVVKPMSGCGGICIGIGTHAQTGHGACAQDLHEFTFRKVHSFVLTDICKFKKPGRAGFSISLVDG